jgi:hypothetical protein
MTAGAESCHEERAAQPCVPKKSSPERCCHSSSTWPATARSDGDFLCDNSLFSLANRQPHLTKWIGASGKAMSRDGLVVVIFFELATALAMGFLAVALSFPELMPWYSEPSPPG